MFLRFSHLTLYAENLDRAIEWYSEKLGFEVSVVTPGRVASLRHRELRVSFDIEQLPQGERVGPRGPVPYLDTQDLDLLLVKLEKRGVKAEGPIRKEGFVRYASIRDSEGNLLGLEEAK